MSERRFVVVGAGLSGCAVAHALATRGAQVDVLERAVPGAEASSAAAGILAPRMEAHGHEPLRSLGIASLGMYPEWLAALERDSGLTADFSRPGLLRVVGEQADPAEMKPDREAVWLEGAVLHRRESSLASPWAAAWWLPDECAVDPRKLMRAVHAAAAGAGARFHTGMTVDRVDADGVTGTSGERFRGVVVVCAGAWTGRIPGLAHVPVRPVRGQLVALQGGIGPRHVIFGPDGYMVPRTDGRTIVGTTVEEVGFARGVTAGGIHRVLDFSLRVCPGLAGAELTESWSGFRPGTPDHLPILGRVDGVWVASGHYRNGLLLAPYTAAAMAAALLDGAPLPAELAPERFVR